MIGRLVLALALCAALSPAASGDSPGAGIFATSELWIETGEGSHRFTVEIADTTSKRALGLMFRDSLPPDAGMLFDFEETAPVAMWMKNTYLPLDMLFIDASGQIIHIHPDTVPLSLDAVDSNGPARAVLELNAGTAARLGIEPGHLVRHPIFANTGGTAS